MTKINFYHLTSSPLGKALPKLLEKVIASGVNALVLAPNDEKVAELNRELWTYTTKVFLPHGSKEDGFCDEQPIYLTAENDNPNKAEILAMVGDSQPTDISAFSKCLYMFDGNDEQQLQAARKRWKQYKEAEFEITYWKQTPKGIWEQSA